MGFIVLLGTFSLLLQVLIIEIKGEKGKKKRNIYTGISFSVFLLKDLTEEKRRINLKRDFFLLSISQEVFFKLTDMLCVHGS